MKLLFDENLSAELPRLLANVFPDSAHLRDIGLKGSDDSEVWEFAREKGYAIVTKDDDFSALSVLRGSPPKLIMIRLGNCPTRDVERLLRVSQESLEAFNSDATASVVELR